MSASGWSGSNYINIADAVNITQFTLAARVKCAAVSSQIVIGRSDGNPASTWTHELRINSSVWQAYVFAGGIVTDDGPTATTDWQTVIATFDQGVGVECFVDGISGGATSAGGTFYPSLNTWHIGRASGGGSPFNGKIAWAGMIPRVLSPREIVSLNEYHPRYVQGWRFLADLIGAAPIIHTKLAATIVGSLTPSKDNPRLLG